MARRAVALREGWTSIAIAGGRQTSSARLGNAEKLITNNDNK